MALQRIDERSLVARLKPELRVLDTEELNAEAPAHRLDDDITPLNLLFARNSGAMPAFAAEDIADWALTIDGFVERPRRFTLAELARIRDRDAGHGDRMRRQWPRLFPDPAGRVMWRLGAVGCVQWTGVRLGDVLRACGVRAEAVYTGHHSPDVYLDSSGPAISRGLPIDKALAPETLVATAINGEPLPALHGGPLRLVAPGYPGASFQKWLNAHQGARPRARRRTHGRRPLPDAAHAAALRRSLRP